jgi:hypothetical protein
MEPIFIDGLRIEAGTYTPDFAAWARTQPGYGRKEPKQPAMRRLAPSSAAAGPALQRLATAAPRAATEAPALDAENFPAFDGPVSGIVVNEVFASQFGPTLLEADGDMTASFAGVPILGTASRLGDGTAKLTVSGNRLRLLVCLSAKDHPGLADEARETTFAADWYADEPDEHRTVGGQRVAVFNVGGWALSEIHLSAREGREFCVVK